MKLDLKEILELQKVLDKRIEKKLVKTIFEKDSVTSKKLLAFIVELSELANETRCFKYWSTKSSSSDEVVFEEYADGLHFLLSIGLTKDWKSYCFDLETTKTDKKEYLVNVFNEIINISTLYFQNQEEDKNYFTILNKYIQLGGLLGMTVDDITSSYKRKNNINHKRQDEGY